MSRIEWADPAVESYDAYLGYLAEYDLAKAAKVEGDLQKALARLVSRPGIGRHAEWPGLMKSSLTDVKKIIVYRELPDGIRIIAFYDARQDLSVVHPTPND